MNTRQITGPARHSSGCPSENFKSIIVWFLFLFIYVFSRRINKINVLHAPSVRGVRVVKNHIRKEKCVWTRDVAITIRLFNYIITPRDKKKKYKQYSVMLMAFPKYTLNGQRPKRIRVNVKTTRGRGR